MQLFFLSIYCLDNSISPHDILQFFIWNLIDYIYKIKFVQNNTNE